MMEAGCDPNTSPNTDASARIVSDSGEPSSGACSPVTGSVSGPLSLAVSSPDSRASSTDSGHGSSPKSSSAPGKSSSQNLPPELACLRSPKKLEEDKLPSNADVLRHCVHTRKFSLRYFSKFTDVKLVKQVVLDIVDTWQKLGKLLKTRAEVYSKTTDIDFSRTLLMFRTFRTFCTILTSIYHCFIRI